ncbi:efflux RND transporter periplasmic adaptor subunit [Bremerella cremea]|nr:efflux RND transporter periplasmic adaptor subunit [Bremerella cremea]
MSDSSPRKTALSTVGHLVRRGIPLLVLGGVLVTAYYYFEHEDGHAPAHDAGPSHPTDPIPVSVFPPKFETIPLGGKFLGQTEASQVIEVRARVPGHIVQRNFQEGQLVQQGAKLFQIDSRPYEVELLQAQASLARAEAILNQAEVSKRRQETLEQRKATSQQALDAAQSDFQVAMAEVQLQKARIEAAKLQLQYTTIESPVTGRIGQVLTDVGNYISAGGGDPLVTIRKVDPIYVRFPITEHEMLKFRRQVSEGDVFAPPTEDLELEITLADGTIYPYHGRINFQDVQIDQNTGTMVVRGSVPNTNGDLMPGQFIHTTVLGPKRLNVIRVPQVAVRQTPTGASVYVINNDQKVETRPVELGDWSDGDTWIIESGLHEGDKVIVDRLMMLRPGMPVVPSQG